LLQPVLKSHAQALYSMEDHDYLYARPQTQTYIAKDFFQLTGVII